MKEIMMAKFSFHEDPGHGWLEVPRLLVKSLAPPVTNYSYTDATNIYLEEDGDAPRFLDAYKARYPDEDISIVHECYDTHCFIRDLDRYEA